MNLLYKIYHITAWHLGLMFLVSSIPFFFTISHNRLKLSLQWPGARKGLLIRGGDVLERLAGVNYIALDKVNLIFID